MALEPLRHGLVSLLVLLLLLVHAASAARARDLHLEMVTTSAATARAVPSCASWRLGVETNNIRDWYSIPAECRGYVRDYMYGDLFRQDCAVVAREAAAYSEGLELGGDGKEVWVFDVDDTTLSNLPYYADTGFGYARGCSCLRPNLQAANQGDESESFSVLRAGLSRTTPPTSTST